MGNVGKMEGGTRSEPTFSVTNRIRVLTAGFSAGGEARAREQEQQLRAIEKQLQAAGLNQNYDTYGSSVRIWCSQHAAAHGHVGKREEGRGYEPTTHFFLSVASRVCFCSIDR
jgi:hypothetical protein